MIRSARQTSWLVQTTQDLLEGKAVVLDEGDRDMVKALNQSARADEIFEAYRLGVLSKARSEDWRRFISLGRTLKKGTVYISGASNKINSMWTPQKETFVDNLLPEGDGELTEAERSYLMVFPYYWKFEDVGIEWRGGVPTGFKGGKVFYPTRDFNTPKKGSDES